MHLIYLIVSAALIPILNNFYPILRQSRSWWLVPVLFLSFFVGLLLLHLIVFAVCVLVINTKKPQNGVSHFYKNFTVITVKMLFKLARVEIRTTGEEKIPENGRFMLVCNHLNDIDPAVIISQIPFVDLSFIAKKDIYKTLPFVAKVMHKLGCLPINRENNREAAKTIIKAVNVIKNDYSNIAVFPEGYTSKSGELLPFRNGAFKIAIRANVPIVVCSLKGTYKIEKRLFFHKNIIYFNIIDVLEKEKISLLSTNQISDIVHNMIESSLSDENS